MSEKPECVEKVVSFLDAISGVFDTWLETLQGRVYGQVTWQHLQHHLPESSGALVLDAGGGTGRWTVPLAKKGIPHRPMRHLAGNAAAGMRQDPQRECVA